MKRLAVVPSDKIEDYLNQGYSSQWLKDYYNPGKFFDEVYLLSNLEKDQPDLLGMKVIHTGPKEFAKRLKELKIDVVRAYGGNWACTYACEHKVPGVPVVVSVHDSSPLKLYDSIKHADYVLCMSRAVKDLVATKFDHEDRIWILPNRVDFKTMRPMSQDQTKDLDEKYPFTYKILHVGRLSEEKNLDTLIKALPLLGDDYGVVAIGHGDPTAYKKLAHGLNVLQRVAFIEAVPNQELARYYSWSSCMCTPSRREGFGMVFVEALACASVVITSDIAPLNEYIINGENGLLVKDFENPQSLAQMIQKGCTEEDLRAKLKSKARESVLNFEKESIDLQEINYYKKVLEMKNDKITMCYQKALAWVKQNTLPEGGIIVNTKQRVPYLEVTGYFIPTLIQAHEWDLARSYAEFLAYMQQPDGSYRGSDGKKYVFDSGQALRGLSAAAQLWPEFKPAALKTADYIFSQIEPNGHVQTSYDYEIPEHIPLFILPALYEVGSVFGRPDYVQASLRSTAYYKQQPNVLNPKILTHFLAYILDGFIDMGEADFVRPFVEKLFSTQGKDGRIRGFAGAHWVCSVGMSQLAIVGYKLGMTGPADRALDYVCSIQNPSGGFYGSYGWGAKYFPKAEISWANKFFLDAIHYSRMSPPNASVGGPGSAQVLYSRLKHSGMTIPLLDEQQWHKVITAGQSIEELTAKIKSNIFPVWCKPLLTHTKPEDVLLELGSGTGELAAICATYGRSMHLLDYSKESNAFAGQLFQKLGLTGEFHCHDILQGIPLNSASVDWVYSSGVLEHFSDEQIIGILKESKRLSRRGVMSLVPNANAIFYRIGKNKMEQEGTWKYGHEDPKWTMRPLFEAAGLSHIQEYSIGTYHALEFWGNSHDDIKKFFDQCSPEQIRRLNQGYLLFTIGII